MPTKRTRRQQKSSSNTWVIGGIVLVAIVAVIIIVIGSNSVASGGAAVGSFSPPAAAPLDKCVAAACGQENAPVTIDVYSDFQCPYCKAFEPALQQLSPDYVDTGKVKVVYHNFPVIGPESESAAQASLCAADQNKFWMFAHDMFAHQGKENSGVFTLSNLKQLAAAAGLDRAQFNSCLDSGKYSSQVNQDAAGGRQKGVKATPTFFVNGQIHEGSVSYTDLKGLVDAALPK
jgi:protein-disulfide isomerase